MLYVFVFSLVLPMVNENRTLGTLMCSLGFMSCRRLSAGAFQDALSLLQKGPQDIAMHLTGNLQL